MQDFQHIINDLKEFGLTEDESKIYLFLLKEGKSTSYQISKQIKIGRSKVYGLIKLLIEKNLIFEIKKGTYLEYQAYPYKNLANLIQIKELKIQELKSSLSDVYNRFSELISEKSGTSNVMHYYGVDGLKQVIWNSLKADGVIRIFEVSRLSAFLQKSFAEEYRRECSNRGIVNMDLTNEQHMAGWTDVDSFVNDYSKLKYIDPKILKIQFEIYIYNDIVVMSDYKDEEIFCIEIQNASLAALQKQLFDYVWKDAVEMKVVGPRGESKIIG